MMSFVEFLNQLDSTLSEAMQYDARNRNQSADLSRLVYMEEVLSLVALLRHAWLEHNSVYSTQ